MDLEENILAEIEAGIYSREEIAQSLAICIKSREDMNMGHIFRAVEEWWGRKGLQYIIRGAFEMKGEKGNE